MSYGQRFAVKVNVLSPIVRTWNFAAEYAFGKHSSGQMGFSTTNLEIRKIGKIEDLALSGTALTAEYRYYLKAAPRGFYAAPFVRRRNFELSRTDVNAKADFSSWTGAIVLGHQFIIRNRVTIDFFIGPSFSSHTLKVTVGSIDDFKLGSLTGPGLRTGLTVGVAF